MVNLLVALRALRHVVDFKVSPTCQDVAATVLTVLQNTERFFSDFQQASPDVQWQDAAWSTYPVFPVARAGKPAVAAGVRDSGSRPNAWEQGPEAREVRAQD